MVFYPKFTPSQFLDVLDFKKPRSLLYISRLVGCSKNTTIKNIKILECNGDVKRVYIEGSTFYGYIKVKNTGVKQ